MAFIAISEESIVGSAGRNALRQLHLSLSAGPEAFRVLTGGCELDGAYRFSSLTIKGLERRLDGILEPEGHAGPAYVV